MPNKGNFVELTDTSSSVRKPATTTNVEEEDDDLSLASQDIDNVSEYRPKKTVKDYIAEKKVAVQNFNVTEFAQTKKHQIETFSLDEFMSDKRKVLFRAVGGELLVTTLFMFIVCAVGLNLKRSGHADTEALVAGALCTGFSAVALIYSFADVSGAHFNPAVTFGTVVTGKTSLAKGALYMAAQILGSLLAMLLLTLAFPRASPDLAIVQELVVVPAAGASIAGSFLMEFLLTFILVYVIFATAFDTVNNSPTTVRLMDDKGNAVSQKSAKNLTIYTASGNSKAGFAPLSIGLTLGFLCFLGGGVSGGAFNPARVLGAGLFAGNYQNHWAYMWIYWLGDFLGAACAALLQQKVFATSLLNPPASQPS